MMVTLYFTIINIIIFGFVKAQASAVSYPQPIFIMLGQIHFFPNIGHGISRTARWIIVQPFTYNSGSAIQSLIFVQAPGPLITMRVIFAKVFQQWILVSVLSSLSFSDLFLFNWIIVQKQSCMMLINYCIAGLLTSMAVSGLHQNWSKFLCCTLLLLPFYCWFSSVTKWSLDPLRFMNFTQPLVNYQKRIMFFLHLPCASFSYQLSVYPLQFHSLYYIPVTFICFPISVWSELVYNRKSWFRDYSKSPLFPFQFQYHFYRYVSTYFLMWWLHEAFPFLSIPSQSFFCFSMHMQLGAVWSY